MADAQLSYIEPAEVKNGKGIGEELTNFKQTEIDVFGMSRGKY